MFLQNFELCRSVERKGERGVMIFSCNCHLYIGKLAPAYTEYTLIYFQAKNETRKKFPNKF